MQGKVKESLCARCKNKILCKYINQLVELEVQVDKMNVESPHNVNVICKFYIMEITNIR